ncbi:hypothetical protein [Paenibacillus ihbetae]|uniref:hypothetical protein n=1 Tax=Paenibacillus ihbetae TaxID=1870820 RepID=UPI0012FFE38B|nr:hypothetical protein [Paenibacillus ihbetae]
MSDHRGTDGEEQMLFVDEQGQSKPGKRIEGIPAGPHRGMELGLTSNGNMKKKIAC